MATFKGIDVSVGPLAHRNYTVYLNALKAFTQAKAAPLLGCAESTLSEWATDHMERATQVMAAYGLKIVPKQEKTISAAEIAAYKLLARKAMDQEEPDTAWGDDL